jgi:hypothetical protein
MGLYHISIQVFLIELLNHFIAHLIAFILFIDDNIDSSGAGSRQQAEAALLNSGPTSFVKQFFNNTGLDYMKF